MKSGRRAALGAAFFLGILLLAVSILIPGMLGEGSTHAENDIRETEGMLFSISAGENSSAEVGEGVRFAGRCLADAKAADALSYTWDFGDGTGETGTVTPLHAYATEGVYTVTLTVTDAQGNDQNDSISVTVEPSIAPGAADGGEVPPTAPSPVATALETPVPAPQPSATATPASSGSSSSSDDDDDETLCDFSASVREGPAPLTVRFSDASPAVAEKWFWEFGDGGSSTEQNPTHEYTAPGSYSVYLTVEDEDDEQYREIKNGFIVVTEPPLPPQTDFTADATSGEAPLSVSFTDRSVGAPTSWSWSFGDGGSSTDQNPAHEYTAAGTYTVSLTAANAFGSVTEKKEGYITVGEAAPALEADFSADRTSGEAPLSVSFTDRSEGAPTSWSWSFGDGGSSTDQNPVHEYTAPGTYTVALTVGDGSDTSVRTRTNYITVEEAEEELNADFTADITSGYAPLTVQFEDMSSGEILGYAWDFGDGRLGSRSDPTHRYREPGTYTVSLTVFGLHGMDTATKTGFITVLADETPLPEETPELMETPEPTEEPDDDGDDDRRRDDERWR